MTLRAPNKKELQALVPRLKLCRQLGAGGNAIVYSAKSCEGQIAVKFLVNTDAKRFGRFRDEVLVVTTTLKNSLHVIPILEHHLPAVLGTEPPWYSMPVATPLRKHLEEATMLDRLTALADLADGLADLHERNVAHRDIKPENLFFFEETLRYGDFGIAKFPDSSGLTTDTEPMGPRDYMADEMIRDSASADPCKADVFSFAKTLWVLLTGQQHPFAGQYSRDGKYSLDTQLTPSEFVHEPLDDLLEQCTHNTPNMRPTAREVANALRRALDEQTDFSSRNSLQWRGAETLALSVPCSRIEWTTPTEIVRVLNLLSRRRGLNHCFLPDGGGWDITKAELTEGGNAILLWHDEFMASVVKPIRLTLERLAAGPEGSYATLESAELDPFGVREKGDWDENLLRIDDYNYLARPSEDDPWPSGLASVSRYFKPGMFIIAPKGGIYNKTDSYEATGNALGRDQLRGVFEGALKQLAKQPSTFGLSRLVRLVKQPSDVLPTLLSVLSLGKFEELVALDDAMKSLLPADRNFNIETILNPDPAQLAKRREVVQFLEGLSDEEFGEAVALMNLGRGVIAVGDLQAVCEMYSRESKDIENRVDLFGRNSFRKAAQRAGFTLVHAGRGA
jgi:hypothetical protein